MKVLEVNVDDIGAGGVFSFVKNVIIHKSEDVQIDIAAIEPFENPGNITHLAAMGCAVHYVGYRKSKVLKQFYCFYNLYRLLRAERYDCMHIHADVANKLFVSGMAGRAAGMKKIILHSHATEVDGQNRWMKRLFHKLCRRSLKYIATDFVSCSDLATQWMFPNVRPDRVIRIKNGVQLEKFRFDALQRDGVRKKLGVENRFVVGNVGRFAYQKNHEYLIDVFAALKSRMPSAVLLLVGEGDLRDKIECRVKLLGLADDVIFYGVSPHVSALLQAMDVFVLPSHFEGLPIVGVEAQASGLPVLFSSAITREARLTDAVRYLPIDDAHKEVWVENIVQLSQYRRYDTYDELYRRKFDICQTVEELMELYVK